MKNAPPVHPPDAPHLDDAANNELREFVLSARARARTPDTPNENAGRSVLKSVSQKRRPRQ